MTPAGCPSPSSSFSASKTGGRKELHRQDQLLVPRSLQPRGCLKSRLQCFDVSDASMWVPSCHRCSLVLKPHKPHHILAAVPPIFLGRGGCGPLGAAPVPGPRAARSSLVFLLHRGGERFVCLGLSVLGSIPRIKLMPVILNTPGELGALCQRA